MYNRYSKIIVELHQDFFRMVNQTFAQGIGIPMNAISEAGLRKIGNREVVLVEENKRGGQILFRPKKVVYTSRNYGDFSVEYKSYSGLVAARALRKYQNAQSPENPQYRYRESLSRHGLFDFYFDAKRRYRELFDGDATHYNIFCDLRNHVTYEQCLDVTKGIEINHTNLSDDASDVLVVLSWLLFEQEVNYGSLSFQQFTNFKRENNFRPRDMIMGFLNMMYKDIEVFNSYPYWNFDRQGSKTSPTFGSGGYKNLDEMYKKYFEDFQGYLNEYPTLFCHPLRRGQYNQLANLTGDNPNIIALR